MSMRGRGRIAAAAAGFAVTEATVDAAKENYIKDLFSDVLGVRKPPKLELFLSVAQGSGWTILAKDEWRKIGGDLHAYLLPLAIKGDYDDENIQVLGLIIRSPNGSSLQPHEYQVVTQRPKKSWKLNLVAMDMEKYVMKRAEEANFRNGKEDQPIVEATKGAYQVRFAGKDRTALDKWLLLEVGAFPDVYKNLAMEHIEGDDPKTGLIIADTMRDAFGTTWGFPHAFVTQILREHFDGRGGSEDRAVEADHSAQRCFTSGYPLWTLEDDDTLLKDLLLEAKMPRLSSVDDLRVFYIKRSTDDQRAAVRTGNISLGCAAVSRAQALMDAVCCGHKSFDRIREELRDIYDEVPGFEPLVEMMEYFRKK